MSKLSKSYLNWLQQIKDRIRSAQIKAALIVNAELLTLYWDLGIEILDKERNSEWGDKLIDLLAKDLSKEFPNIKGLSRRNLFYIRKFVLFWHKADLVQQAVAPFGNPPNKNQTGTRLNKNKGIQQPVEQKQKKTRVQQPVALLSEKLPQAVAEIRHLPVGRIPSLLTTIPWGHHLQLISKCGDVKEALYYISQTTEHNWSRSMLVHQMESRLYKRKGKTLNNFNYTLPKLQSDLANELLKNPYNFDFLMLGPEVSEKELEDALLTHLTKFLLELGAGFAFLGRQYKIPIEEKDYELDLLFYHIRLRCYIVIELKIDDFKPEYAGKLNFYLSAVDTQVKTKEDQSSIGLLLCKKAGRLTVEYSLKDIGKPIGVSEYHLTGKIPMGMKGKLPTIKEIEQELKNIAK